MDLGKLYTLQENYFVQFEHTSLPRGGMNIEDVNELNHLAMETRQANIMIADVGCWTGQSTSILANVAETYGGKVFAIDWFRGSATTNLEWAGQYYDIKRIFEDNIKRFSFKDRIEIVEAISEIAVQKFEDNFFDFVFIDADHRYDYIKADIARWLPKVKSGGILCGHDCEVVIRDGLNSLFKIYNNCDTIKEIHLGVCKAVGELGGQKARDIDKFQPHETLTSSIWYYKKP